jgi:hypothetical protein
MQIKLLEQSDLVVETRDYDELDKDMLIVRSKNNSLNSMVKKYPKIPKEKLLKLQQSLSEMLQ